MKKFIIVLVILFAAVGYYKFSGEKYYSTKSEKALATYEEALDYLFKFYMFEGVAAMKQAINEDPDFPMPQLFALFNPYAERKKRERIKKQLLKELENKNNNWTDFEKKMVRLMTDTYSNDKKQVIAEIEKMFRKYSEQKEVFYLLLPKYDRLINKPDKILSYYEKLHKMYPNNVQILNKLGYLYGEMGMDEKAKETFEKYIFIRPDEPNPYDSYGDCYYIGGNLKVAKEMYEKALSKDSDFLASRMKLATILMLKGQLTKALEIVNFLKSSEYNEVFDDYYRLKLIIHYLKGDIKGMDRVIKEAKKSNISKWSLINLKFYYFVAKNNIEKMRNSLAKLKPESPDKGWRGTYYNYQSAIVLLKEKKFKEARDLLKQVNLKYFRMNVALKNDVISRQIEAEIGLKNYDNALKLAKSTVLHEDLYWQMKVAELNKDVQKAKEFAEKVLKAYNDADKDFYIVKEASNYVK
jgi:tetratricopeptide (TPR) repeat protein